MLCYLKDQAANVNNVGSPEKNDGFMKKHDSSRKSLIRVQVLTFEYSFF